MVVPFDKSFLSFDASPGAGFPKTDRRKRGGGEPEKRGSIPPGPASEKPRREEISGLSSFSQQLRMVFSGTSSL
jgi:hypothetical protein